jgi:hypothetical protein
MRYLHGIDEWRKFNRESGEEVVRETVFIVVHTNRDTIYIPDYKDWLTIDTYLKSINCEIHAVGFQWKTHAVEFDITDADGVYIAQTLRGEMGGKTKRCMSVGIIYGDTMQKQLWTVPELIKDIEYEDVLDNCLKEALYFHEKKR